MINDTVVAPIACTPSTIRSAAPRGLRPGDLHDHAADVANGSVDNSATASGTPPGGTDQCSTDHDHPTMAPAPALSLVKTAGTPTDVNGTASPMPATHRYSFAVSNDGNAPVNVASTTLPSATPIACTPSTIPVGGIQAVAAR
ncbi:hypothetical protein [Luteimonas mephitis]|uniref:hypothetical protein n=1 Tax=Luteimonas mephitis TaxID=83615 RepID=UPI003A8D9733